MFRLLPSRCGISQSTSLRGPTSSLALVPFCNRCGTPQSTLLRGSVFLLAHCPLLFRVQCPRWHSFLSPINMRPHTLLQGPVFLLAHRLPHFGAQLVPFFNRCGPPNPPSFRAQCSCWHTALCPLPSGLNFLVSTSPGVRL